MLWHKAWLESRARFFAGLLAMTALSILFVRLRPILIPQWVVAARDPLAAKPAWLPLGISDYGFYVWHFLYDYQLQNLWVLFAVLLSFGGLVRERAQGAALYSLGLPVSRRLWLLTRASVALLESAVLALVPALVVPLASLTVGEEYRVGQGIGHSLLLVGAGSLFIGLSTLLTTLLKGEWTALAVTLPLLGLPYLFLQEYVREVTPTSWAFYVDISHLMAGPWRLTWGNVPWAGLGVVWLLTGALTWLGVRYGDGIDY